LLLLVVSVAAAKEFGPRDLSVCAAKRCFAIENRPVLRSLAGFYYDPKDPPVRVGAPRLGTPFFRLEFANGYVTGIVAGPRLDRFLSYGVNLDQFSAGVWYRVPPGAAADLKRLAASLTPLRLTPAALRDGEPFAGGEPATTRPSPRTRQATAPGEHRDSAWWPFLLGALVALTALASLAGRRRHSASPLPVPRHR
jgi:hypothetical protein